MSLRPTIKDVAAAAGVSIKTVSRVLNEHPYVRPATKLRVDEAMRRLDFKPSIAARILSGAKSNQIALIYDNHSPYYMHQVLTGCWERCHAEGVRLVAQPVVVTEANVGDEVRDLIAETHIDGAILSSPVTDCEPVLRALEIMNVPFVRISPGTNHARSSSVYMDDVQAADDMTTHLINLRHRRIGFIKGHPDHLASEDRLAGYRRSLDRAGINFDPKLVVEGAFDFDSGRAAAIAFLDMAAPPTAIFASNDDMAAGVLAVAHGRGINLPNALSVVGFDDTTLARTATSLLLSGEFAHRRLDHRLVERASAVRRAHQE